MRPLGSRQALRLFQLSCGYMVCRDGFYDDLIAKGYVEVSDRYRRGDIEYERKDGRESPGVTWDGLNALKAYVRKNGALEFELTPLMAHYKQVFRMEVEAA